MLRRLLQIRRGESTRTILLFAYLFLVISSYVVIKSTRDALFLERYSAARLPYAELASAVSVAGMMGIYLRVDRRVGLLRLLTATLLTFSATSLAFWALSRSGEPFWMLPVLYVWASVSGVLLPAQVWTLANCVVTTREAKRLFGIIGSGALTGWVVGGLITRATATHLGTETLLLMTALTLAICPVLVAAIWRERRIEPAVIDHAEARSLTESLGLVWHSRHLRAIGILICLSSVVTTVVAWQFRAIAKAFIPDTDALAAFFGTFNIYAGGVSLIAQLVLTSRLLRRFGVGIALLVVPCVLMAGSLGVLMLGTLWSAIILKGGDQSLRYSIDRSTVELLYLPIPARQMSHAKAFIDTVIYRAGDAVGALLVLVAVSFFAVTPSELSIASVLLLGAWIIAAVSAKQYYVQNLRNSLYEHRADAERWSAQVDERSTSEVLADALGADDPADILYALSLLDGRETSIPAQAVGRLLAHRSSEVRKKTISLLAAADDPAGLASAERLLQSDEDVGVRTEALLYLTRLSDVDPLVRLADLDRVHASSIAVATAQFLARPGPRQNIEAARLLLDVALRGEGPEGYLARLEAARVIGSLPDCFDDQLRRLLEDLAPEVVRLAIRAAASLGKTESVRLVMARLVERELSADATDALAALGARAVPALREALTSEETPPALRRAIPDVLQRVATPEAESALVENLLDPDPILRLRTVTALNKVRQLNPDRLLERELIETVLAAEILGHYRSYQLLGKLSVETIVSEPALHHVKDSMSHELERIFRLMKLLLPQHDLHSAYVGLQSGSAVVHANSVEFLEHALPVQLRTLLLPLIDSEVGLAERIRLAERMVGATEETSKQALAAFSASDELLREAAANAEQRLGSHANNTIRFGPLTTESN
jgi:ATP:ADP antiporter, AAA family